MEGFQLHLQQQETQQRQQQEALLRQQEEVPVAHHPNEQSMLQNLQEETFLIEDYLTDPEC